MVGLSTTSMTEIFAEVIIICSEFRKEQKDINSKELKFANQIAVEIAEKLTDSILPLPAALGALDALAAIFSVPGTGKRIMENVLPRILEAMKPSDTERFIGSFGVIYRVFRSLDDDGSCATLLQMIEKSGCIQKLFVFVTQASVLGNNNLLCCSTVILELVFWALTRTHPGLVSLRSRFRSVAFQHRDSLFELSRHPIRKISHVTTMLLIRLMMLEDRMTCVAIQVVS